MREVAYLILFGLLTLTPITLTIAWGRMALKRFRALSWRDLTQDRYAVLATALAIENFGTMFLFGSRLYTVLWQGYTSSIVAGMAGLMILAGMSIMLFAKYGFMWALEMDRRNRDWILFLIMTIAWTTFAIWWAFPF